MRSGLTHLSSLFWKRRALQLTFFVTRQCNARCPFCFNGKARDREDGAPELSLDEIRRTAGSLGNLLWVLFSGGEVFLREDLIEISAIFHDANRPRFLTFPTNGLLPEIIAGKTDGILKRCRESIVVVKLSLDGVNGDHDALRQLPGGFQKAMQTYERLSRLAEKYPRLELGVNTLFCSENQWRMDGIIDFVRGLKGIRSHTVTMVRGHLKEGTYRDVDLTQYDRVIRRFGFAEESPGGRSHRFIGGRFKTVQDDLQRKLIHRTLSSRRRQIPCYAGRLNLVLKEAGDVYPCEMSDHPFGNVRDVGYDLGKMRRSRRARDILRRIAQGDCYCSHECHFVTNILFNPRMVPRLIWDYLRCGFEWLQAKSPQRGLPEASGGNWSVRPGRGSTRKPPGGHCNGAQTRDMRGHGQPSGPRDRAVQGGQGRRQGGGDLLHGRGGAPDPATWLLPVAGGGQGEGL